MRGQRREIATLFTDIAGFTTLVETLEPDVLAPLLNDYLVGMTDVVFAHDGTVAKIIGDAIHVLFGAPGEQPIRPTRAVACALALDERAQGFCETLAAKRELRLVSRASAPMQARHWSETSAASRFFDYTAYGDTINVTARLESANKQLGTRICVSAALAGKVEEFHGRPVGDLVLRGRSEALRAFEPVSGAQFKSEAVTNYLEAFVKVGGE